MIGPSSILSLEDGSTSSNPLGFLKVTGLKPEEAPFSR